MIEALVEQGVYQKDIAQKLGVHPKTVSRAIQRGSAPGKPRKVSKAKWNHTKRRLIKCYPKGSGMQ